MDQDSIQPQVPPTASIPNQQPVAQAPSTPVPVTAPKKKFGWKTIVLIVIAVLVAGFAYMIYQGVSDSPLVHAKLESFLQNVSDGDYDGAYTLTSVEFKDEVTRSDFTVFMDSSKAMYSDFGSLEQTGFVIESNNGQTVFNYEGIITYTDGNTGDLTSVLVKRDDEYRIVNVNVSVDMERINKYPLSGNDSVLGEFDFK